MAFVCSKTGKRPSSGCNVSHSERHTKRRFLPNIQKKRVFDPATGTYRRIKVSTAYLRTLAKRLRQGQTV